MACPQAGAWRSDAASVARLQIGGTRLCSGVLVNNLRQDLRPYVLTADHCQIGNAVTDARGGMAVAVAGRVTALLPLPVAGLVSDAPLAAVAADFEAVRLAMNEVVDWSPPYLVFKALVGATLACNAGPHQTDLGVADALAGKLLPSPILEDALERGA